jgi:hypothetical protein
MKDRNIILTVNVVEPGLVRAVNMHSKTMGKQLRGLVLVHSGYANQPGRPRDTTGLFEEVICDFDNQDELQLTLKPYADRILAATCRYEEALQPFSQVIPFLPYIYTPSDTALLWSTEKPLMRDRLRNYDKNLVPRYQNIELEDLPKLKTLIKDFTFPVIVKPSGLSKALLVTECKTEKELKDRLEHTFTLIYEVYAREQYPGKPSVLVEEMIQGEMYSTDAYVTHKGEVLCLPLVRVITAHSVGLPGFYGHQRVVPTGLSNKEVEAAFAASRAAIRALNLSATTAHVELFRTSKGWKIIEVAARMGGYRDGLYREAYGIEHFYNDLAVRMGQQPKMPGKLLKHAAVLNIYADDEGYIESIQGIEKARKLSSIVYIDSHAKPGDKALFATNGGNPIVDGILSNKDPQRLKRDIAKVRELIKINLSNSGTINARRDYTRPSTNPSTLNFRTDRKLIRH